MRSLTYTYAEMLASRGLAILGSFGVAILTARMLGPAERGQYYYIMTLAAMSVQFASLGIHASNSYLIARSPAILPQIMANTARIAIVSGIVASAGALVFDFFIGDFGQSSVLVATVLTLTPLLLMFLYLSNIAVALNRPRAFNLLIIFNSVVSVGMASLAAYPNPSLNGFLAAAVISAFAACAVAWIALARGIDIPRSFDSSLFLKGIAFAARSHIATLLGFLMARMSVMVTRELGNFAELGYWSIAAQISDALLVLPATISLLLFPSLVRVDGLKRWLEFRTTLFRLGSIMAVLCIVTAVLAHTVIAFIFGAAYVSAVAIVLALLPGVFFLSIASVTSQFLSAHGNPWSQVFAWICGAFLQALLSLEFFGRFGVVGLASIQSGCAGFVCLWLLLNSLKFTATGRQ